MILDRRVIAISRGVSAYTGPLVMWNALEPFPPHLDSRIIMAAVYIYIIVSSWFFIFIIILLAWLVVVIFHHILSLTFASLASASFPWLWLAMAVAVRLH